MVLTRRLGSLRRPQNGDRASGVRTDVPKVRTTISILIDLAIYSAPMATRVRPRGNIHHQNAQRAGCDLMPSTSLGVHLGDTYVEQVPMSIVLV